MLQIESGNTFGHLTINSNNATAPLTPAAPTTSTLPMVTIGNQTFGICVNPPPPLYVNSAPATLFAITTTQAMVVSQEPLDHEFATYYDFLVTLNDTGYSPPRMGQAMIKVMKLLELFVSHFISDRIDC